MPHPNNPMVPSANPDRSSRTAMIVDHNPNDQLQLKTVLQSLGFQVFESKSSREAVKLFYTNNPDFIFFDVTLPGYISAIREIKSADELHFIPIIAIAESTDKPRETNADDILYKPYNSRELPSKINLLQKLIDLSHKNQQLQNRIERDGETAEQLYTGTITAGNVKSKYIQSYFQPVAQDYGDILLTEYTLSSDLALLLVDFSGNGLSAVASALPSADIFRAMCKKGFSLTDILTSFNSKLHTLLPTNRFVAAQFVIISHDMKFVLACNCAMPDILIIDGEAGTVRSRIPSAGLPLGITPDLDFNSMLVRVSIQPGDRIVLLNNGFADAQNNAGIPFGQSKTEQCLANRAPQLSLDSVITELDAYRGNKSLEKDISIVEIQCHSELFANHQFASNLADNFQPISTTAIKAVDSHKDRWDYQLTLEGIRLAKTNPIPIIIAQIQELDTLADHQTNLYTILTELYVNAIDHGILKLNSSLKQSPQGFVEYFNKRELRLSQLKKGCIQISLSTEIKGSSGKMTIRIKDSGTGFQLTSVDKEGHADTLLHGRGIILLKELCESVEYKPPGNYVEVVYAWEE